RAGIGIAAWRGGVRRDQGWSSVSPDREPRTSGTDRRDGATHATSCAPRSVPDLARRPPSLPAVAPSPVGAGGCCGVVEPGLSAALDGVLIALRTYVAIASFFKRCGRNHCTANDRTIRRANVRALTRRRARCVP